MSIIGALFKPAVRRYIDFHMSPPIRALSEGPLHFEYVILL